MSLGPPAPLLRRGQDGDGVPSTRRIAWITGGGRGIGRAAALALAPTCDVALSARSVDELRRVAEDCRKLGARAIEAPCDFTDARAIEDAHAKVVAELGAPAILVNSAGQAKSAPFHRTTPELMEQLWRLNVMGCYHTMRLALPAMSSTGWGRVVNVASIAGKTGQPYITAYASSKHALLGMTRSVALEVAAKGVTVNAVCPGYVDTPMTDGSVDAMMHATGRSREEIVVGVVNMNPQKRLIEADEVAAAIRYLVSADARGINGQAITIDGGATPW